MAEKKTTTTRVGRGVKRAFPRLPKDQVEALAAGARTKRYAVGETVLREGTFANGFYVVISGQADVSQLDKAGKDAKLRRLGPGDFFGEIGLLAAPRRTATVRAKTDLEVAALNIDQFFGLMKGSAQSAEAVSHTGRVRLRKKAPAPATTKKTAKKPAKR
jgi:CRP-like cAMP-binding protein